MESEIQLTIVRAGFAEIKKKLESVLGPCTELDHHVRACLILTGRTPFELLSELLHGASFKVVKFFISLSPEMRKSFLFAMGQPPTRSDYSSDKAFMTDSSKARAFADKFILLMEALPKSRWPATRDDLAALRTASRLWKGDQAALVYQLKLPGDLRECTARLMSYSEQFEKLRLRFGTEDLDYTAFLRKHSMRKLCEVFEKIQDDATDTFLAKFPKLSWKPLINKTYEEPVKLGWYTFEEISTAAEMGQMAKIGKNCLVSRIGSALDGTHHYFKILRSRKVVGFLEVKWCQSTRTNEYHWDDTDFRDIDNVDIEELNLTKHMLNFVGHLNTLPSPVFTAQKKTGQPFELVRHLEMRRLISEAWRARAAQEVIDDNRSVGRKSTSC